MENIRTGKWVKLDTELIGRLYCEERLSVPEIARRLGVSTTPIIKRLNDLGIKRRGYREANLGISRREGFRRPMPRSIYSKQPLLERFMGWVEVGEQESACWIWKGRIDKTGYGRFGLSKIHRAASAYRVAWELFRGPIPEGMCVCHHCDNPPCVNPEHLFLGTTYDNIHDAMSKGRMSPPPRFTGVEHWNAKLNDTAVLEIRRLSATVPCRELARRFGVDQSTMQAVIDRETWKHV